MKNLLPVLLLSLVTITQMQAQSSVGTVSVKAIKNGEGYTITGNVQGLGDTEVKISRTSDNQVISATHSKDGAFQLSGAVEEPGLYWLTIGTEQPRYIFLENANIKISGNRADIKNIKIEGSNSHKDFVLFEETFTPLFANLNKVAGEINATNSDSKKASLMPQYNQALAALHTEVDRFVTARKSSYVSLLVLSVTMQSNDDVVALEKRYNSLSKELKASQMGKEIANYISFAKVGAIGTDAIDFTQNDVNDKPVSLSSFKGKYVLIDFWASWCKPCRLENPTVVKAFNKFKDKNFTVLGVSLDQRKEAWINAIEKDNLTWTQVSDLQYWNNAAAQLYRVQSIPQNFLIDPNGKIVAKDLRGPELEKRLCEYLGCK